MIRPVKVFRKGRKCRHPRCKHILSVYNCDTYCHVHSDYLSQEKRVQNDVRLKKTITRN